MRPFVFCAALTCALAFGSPAATPAHHHARQRLSRRPDVAGTGNRTHLPAARVNAALRDYSHWVDQLAAEHRTAGLATAVIVSGKVRYERTLGYADAATGARVRPDTVFRVASLSKAFASALTGILVRQGRLSWNTRIASALPFFHLQDADASRQVTVHDVLSQSVGLPHHTYDHLLSDGTPYRKLERELDSVPLTCDPGDCYAYQNVAFSLIGDVIHARTGRFFIKLVDRYLFTPLGMTTASYGLAGLESSHSWARPHYRHDGRWIAFKPNDHFYIAPAAGVNASIRDMEQWLIAQMGDRPKILPKSLLTVLHQPVIATPNERFVSNWRRARVRSASYALGWRVYDYAGHTLIFHAGAVRGYRAMIGFFPEYHIGAIALWNCENGAPAGLMPMLFDALLGLPHRDWSALDSYARLAGKH